MATATPDYQGPFELLKLHAGHAKNWTDQIEALGPTQLDAEHIATGRSIIEQLNKSAQDFFSHFTDERS